MKHNTYTNIMEIVESYNITSSIITANELEKKGVEPYVISDAGYFSSNKSYPTMEFMLNNSIRTIYDFVTVVQHGDTILQVRSDNGKPFSYKFMNNLDFIRSDDNGILKFESGFPIVGLSMAGSIGEYDKESKFYVTYEFYGNEKRRELANTHLNEIFGCPSEYNGVKFKQEDDVYQLIHLGINSCHIATVIKV